MPATRLSCAIPRRRSSLRVLLVFGVLAGVGPAALFAASAQAISPCSSAGGVTTCTYSTTGEQQITVPAGVSAINIDAIGGAGGAGGAAQGVGGSGGLGAEVTATLPLAGSGPVTLYVEVGGDGTNTPAYANSNLPGGFNGGGTDVANPPDGSSGGGGGGASDVRAVATADGLSPDTRMIVAGGGGAGGGPGSNGGSGDAGANPGDGGGGYESPGYRCDGDGGGASATQGGAGGAGQALLSGSLGQGGTSRGSGGGGGGYYGGGAGGGCGSGGAGSSYVTQTATAHAFLTATAAAPSVTISYTVVGPPTVTITTPPNNARYAYGQSVDANYTCTAGAGATLKSCVGTVANGSLVSTSTVGSGQSFTVTATDTDSQTTTVTNSYTVTAASTSLKAAPQLVLFEPFVGIGNEVVQATLTSGDSPLAGQTVSFGDASMHLCSAPTNAKGVAHCAISSLDQALVNRNNEYTATFAATTDYTGSSSTVPAITFIE
jgi:Glycine rich protein